MATGEVFIEVTDRGEIPVCAIQARVRVWGVIVTQAIADEMSLGVLPEINPPDLTNERFDDPLHFLIKVQPDG